MAALAAGGCLIFAVVLNLAAAMVMLVGLAGMQSACVDFAPASGNTSASVFWGSSDPLQSNSPGASNSGALPLDSPSASPLADASTINLTSALASGNFSDLTGVVHNVTDLVKNMTQAALDTTQSINTLLQQLAHSPAFVTCARTYGLHWWAWVSQVVLAVGCAISLCSGRCMRAAGWPLLLFTGTVVVLDMVLCNQLVQAHSHFYSYLGPGTDLASYASIALSGFILACISNYLYLLCAPTLLRARDAAAARAAAPEEAKLLLSARAPASA